MTQVRAIRPEWSSAAIRRAVTGDERPWHLMAAAMLQVAKDRASQSPGRVRQDGPWWARAARSHSRGATNTVVQQMLVAQCGECGPNRLVELPDGRPARCPRCHPLRALPTG